MSSSANRKRTVSRAVSGSKTKRTQKDASSSAKVAPETMVADGGAPSVAAGSAAAGKTKTKPKAKPGTTAHGKTAAPLAAAAERSRVSAATQVAPPVGPPPSPRRPVEHDLLLAALPHPVIVLAEDNRIVYANAAAEGFI